MPVERGKEGKFSPGPATFVGPAVAHRYKVHRSSKTFFSDGPRKNVFPGPAVVLDVPVTRVLTVGCRTYDRQVVGSTAGRVANSRDLDLRTTSRYQWLLFR